VADVVAGLDIIEAAYLSQEDRRVVALSS
jgi:hypothetical protein